MGLFSRLFGKRPQEVTLKPGRGWTVEVVGESFYQPALHRQYRSQGGAGHDLKVTARLVPEHDNPADPNAVSVHIGGQPVGHLSRDAAADYRASLGMTLGVCGAKIVGGHELATGERAHFGVKLNCSWPPKPTG